MTVSIQRKERLLCFLNRVRKGTINFDNSAFVTLGNQYEDQPCKTSFCVAGDAVIQMGKGLDLEPLVYDYKTYDYEFNPVYVSQLAENYKLDKEEYDNDYLWQLGMIYYQLNTLESELLFRSKNNWIWVKTLAKYLSENELNSQWQVWAETHPDTGNSFLVNKLYEGELKVDLEGMNRFICYLNSKGIDIQK